MYMFDLYTLNHISVYHLSVKLFKPRISLLKDTAAKGGAKA